MSVDGEEVFERLSLRKVFLNPPANQELIGRVERRLDHAMHPFYRDIYSRFDGFETIDVTSGVTVWDLDYLLEFSPDCQLRDGHTAFADVLFLAEVLSCSFSDPHEPVVAAFSGHTIAESSYEFWRGFASGKRDPQFEYFL